MATMKRFWDGVTIAPGEEGFAILLDGRPVRLPGGTPLAVPGLPLAETIAAEWRDVAGGAKGGTLSWDQLPLTRIAGTAQERIAPDPGPVVDGIARYGESDLLCYRAEHPMGLVLLQAKSWQPWLDWAAQRFGARLTVIEGVTHVAQPETALRALHAAVAAYDPHTLAALGVAVPALGSLVLGLALAEGALDAATAHGLATLDEAWQAEQWGEDAEEVIRRRALGSDVEAVGRFMAVSRI